jgi:hypothetical protein
MASKISNTLHKKPLHVLEYANTSDVAPLSSENRATKTIKDKLVMPCTTTTSSNAPTLVQNRS